jgi:Flp pilus assembly protein TadG
MKLQSFKKCQAGNVSMMFAAALLPILGTVGFAVDFSRASEVKSQLVAAVDSTALALAHASVNLTDAQLQAKANELFQSNFNPGTPTDSSSIRADRDSGELTVNGSAALKTAFLRLFNLPTLDVTAKSKVVWGSKQKIEVVLALDNTGSMKGNKLTELKKAAKELIDRLQEARDPNHPDSVKIGIVPFASSVRVDPNTYKTADWIRFDDVQYEQRVCEKKRRDGEWREECHNETRTRAFNKSAWEGCIVDRDKPYDVDDTAYDSKKNGNTLYPAIEDCTGSGGSQDEAKLQVVQPLTTQFSKLHTSIDNMQAAGNTNVTIGIAWAMSLLSHQKPFEDGSAVTTGEGAVKKYLIVLTDGENTKNRFGDNGNGAIDARTKLACEAARTMGTIFTIRMIEGDESLLKTCASDPTRYHDVELASDLTGVFKQVSDEIANLRLAE